MVHLLVQTVKVLIMLLVVAVVLLKQEIMLVLVMTLVLVVMEQQHILQDRQSLMLVVVEVQVSQVVLAEQVAVAQEQIYHHQLQQLLDRLIPVGAVAVVVMVVLVEKAL